MVNNYASLVNLAGWSGVRVYDVPDLKLFILAGWDQSCFVCCLAHRGPIGDSLLLLIFNGGV